MYYKYKHSLYPDIRTLAKEQCVNYEKLKDLIWDKVPIAEAIEKLKELKTVQMLAKNHQGLLSKLTKEQIEMLEQERHFEYIKFGYRVGSNSERYNYEVVKVKNLVEVINVKNIILIRVFIHALLRGESVQDSYEKMRHSSLKHMKDESPSLYREYQKLKASIKEVYVTD